MGLWSDTSPFSRRENRLMLRAFLAGDVYNFLAYIEHFLFFKSVLINEGNIPQII